MKKFLLALALLLGTFGFTQAQTAAPAATGLKKDGTPDMRLKANRVKKTAVTTTQTTSATMTAPQASAPAAVAPTATRTVTTTTAPAAPARTTTVTRQTTTAAPKGADPVLQTDAKGRTIYQGPRGGKYYINKNGHKEYVK